MLDFLEEEEKRRTLRQDWARIPKNLNSTLYLIEISTSGSLEKDIRLLGYMDDVWYVTCPKQAWLHKN
jgi:hypothetical protein